MSKNKLTILLFAIVIALTSYSFWRISLPRVLSIEEMKVNGFYKYGDLQEVREFELKDHNNNCLLYTSPSPRDGIGSRMPSSA